MVLLGTKSVTAFSGRGCREPGYTMKRYHQPTPYAGAADNTYTGPGGSKRD